MLNEEVKRNTPNPHQDKSISHIRGVLVSPFSSLRIPEWTSPLTETVMLERQPPALVVFGNCEADLRLFKAVFEPLSWEVRGAGTWRHAINSIRARAASVFVYDYDSDPAKWVDALAACTTVGEAAPAFVMTARHAEERLWADLLNRGGYDLLAKPLDEGEVSRTLQSAWCSSLRR